MFSFVCLELTKVFQASAGRNPWIDQSKYPKKYPKNHVKQCAIFVLLRSKASQNCNDKNFHPYLAFAIEGFQGD